jgi:hypothetical protein
VLLPSTAEPQAVVAMERLRTAVADHDWAAAELSRPLTVSIGVATAVPGSPGTAGSWRTLFDAADLHLFAAKRSGRNRVRAGSTGPPAARPRGPAPALHASVDQLVADVLGSRATRPPGWAFDDGEVAS